MATQQHELLDIKQAAQLLNVSETSLRRWTNSGRLACLRIGARRERRFRRADLLAFVGEQPLMGGAGGHLCGLYVSDVSRVNLAVAFLAEGFEPGSVSYLMAAPDVREQIVVHLERRRPSLRSDIEAGRLVLSEYPSSGGPQGNHDNWERLFTAATRAGARSLRAVGDVSGGLAVRMMRQELLENEALYDELARRFRVPSLCLYDVRQFSGLDVLDFLKFHPDLFSQPVDRVFG
jgi:excisionase family DNA binding protein